jgi:hypothetical protein
MSQVPDVLVKDLLSTGYFFEELKSYSESTEMGIHTYSRHYAIPYLIRSSESYQASRQLDRCKILNLAVESLSKVNDEDLVDSIFKLKKVAMAQIELNERSLSEIGRHERSEVQASHQQFESAQSLLKLLVNIIRMFKLSEALVAKDKLKNTSESSVDTVSGDENSSVQPGA